MTNAEGFRIHARAYSLGTPPLNDTGIDAPPIRPATPWRDWVGVVLVAAVGCIPIVGQPVQVDDPLFLGVAKQILATLADPFGGPPAWHDGDWFRENANPPLWPYLLAAAEAAFGWNEAAFHGLQCLANVALAFGVFTLARRVTARPLFWTAACLLSPFLLPGRNLMADTLLLALWCWSFELFLQDALDRKRGRGVWAGLLASAALLTKYTGGLLAPLFFLLGWRWRTWRPWAWLLPAVAFAIWCGHNWYFYGRLHFFASVGGGGLGFLDRPRVFTRIVGGVLPWAPVWLLAAWGAGVGWRRVLLGLSLPAAALLAGADLYDVIIRFQLANVLAAGPLVTHFALFIASGLLVFTALAALPPGVGADDPAGRARFGLLTWLAAAAAFNLLATSAVAFGAVRHLLVVLVPAVLLGGDAFDRASAGRWWLRGLAWLTLLVGAGLGGLLAHGDRLAASVGVRVAEEVAGLVAAGEHVWAAGDPALRYHAERVGGRWWRGDPDEVPVGGVVVLPYSRSLPFRQHPLFTQRSGLVRRVHLESWNPVRTQTAYASFYAGNVLTLPWMAETSPRARGPRGGWAYDDLLVYRRTR